MSLQPEDLPPGEKPLRLAVYLETGVAVELPPGTDADSPEGRALLKHRAAERLRRLIDSGDFDLTAEALDD